MEIKPDTEIQKFEIICRKCKQKGLNSHTNMFIHWEKKYYVISCLSVSCQDTEVFDEYGKPINLDEVKAEPVAPDKDKKKMVN